MLNINCLFSNTGKHFSELSPHSKIFNKKLVVIVKLLNVKNTVKRVHKTAEAVRKVRDEGIPKEFAGKIVGVFVVKSLKKGLKASAKGIFGRQVPKG